MSYTINDLVRETRGTLPVETAGEVVGLPNSNASYLAAQRGEMPVIRFGRRMLVPVAPLRRMLGVEAA